MSKGIFITGTDTNVGKTIVSASLAWRLSQRYEKLCIMKPFATADKKFSNQYDSKDLYLLSKSIRLSEDQRYLNPYFYPLAASPYMASKILKLKAPSIIAAYKRFRYLMGKYDYVVVEGIGGLMVPLTKNYSLVDFIKLTRLPVIIISRPILGTINQTLLTIQACQNRCIPIKGIIFNRMPENPTIVEKSTPSFLERMTKVPILGIIPHYKHLRYNKDTFSTISDHLRFPE